MTDFENDISALNTIINLIYEQRIIPNLTILSTKYDSILKNQGSIQELTNLFKPNINTIFTIISDNYKSDLYHYFSEDGLIFYIYAIFQKRLIDNL